MINKKIMLIVAEARGKMRFFTVSLFGHREMTSFRAVSDSLAPVVRGLMQAHPYVQFLIGRNGEFDEFAASVIKAVQKETETQNSELTLVLPYRVAHLEEYERYYQQVLIPDGAHDVHPKSAIAWRNRWMIDRSDLALFFVERKQGGAYTTMKYAEKQSKRMMNLSQGSF